MVADEELDDRTLGLSLDELRSARTSIAVIAGATKHRVAHAEVSSGLCTTLITDEATANQLLGRTEPAPAAGTTKE